MGNKVSIPGCVRNSDTLKREESPSTLVLEESSDDDKNSGHEVSHPARYKHLCDPCQSEVFREMETQLMISRNIFLILLSQNPVVIEMDNEQKAKFAADMYTILYKINLTMSERVNLMFASLGIQGEMTDDFFNVPGTCRNIDHIERLLNY